jgi:hypothetical protein
METLPADELVDSCAELLARPPCGRRRDWPEQIPDREFDNAAFTDGYYSVIAGNPANWRELVEEARQRRSFDEVPGTARRLSKARCRALR